ncbi:hypothetical protein ARMGADRAFT_559420 [Armillaria gallica]|uniref:Uncharacterized protein n=1 Tax=Armillaria gallica TaxID=47427 RepID=A0A2H3CUN3_ARMGA|nr:hypothetical protein ARMGADRAFT_559420 [Armillaria gallica]
MRNAFEQLHHWQSGGLSCGLDIVETAMPRRPCSSKIRLSCSEPLTCIPICLVSPHRSTCFSCNVSQGYSYAGPLEVNLSFAFTLTRETSPLEGSTHSDPG